MSLASIFCPIETKRLLDQDGKGQFVALKTGGMFSPHRVTVFRGVIYSSTGWRVVNESDGVSRIQALSR